MNKFNSSDPKFRNIVSTSVHQAVTEYTQGSGMGNCDLYALAGVILLRQVTKLPYQLQLGSLMYLADPDGHGWFEINARDGGMERMEYHGWIGRAGSLVKKSHSHNADLCEIAELVDFSVRHFKSMTEQMQGITSATRVESMILVTIDPHADRIAWTRPGNPPDYLWTTGEVPDEFRYTPDEKCMIAYHDILKQNPKIVTDMRKLVLRSYLDLVTMDQEPGES